MNYFTADIHFCDESTMRSDNRPFKNVKEYNKLTIKQWNKVAKKGDTIYVAGDLLDCDGPNSNEWKQGLKLVKKVKADIVLVIGNNEQRVIKLFFNNDYDAFVKVCKEHGIKEVYKDLDIDFAGKKFHITHQIKDGKKNRINLFGHTHQCCGLYHPYGLCISCDLNHFRLFTEDIILAYLKRKKRYWEADENCNYINPFIKVVDGKILNVKQAKNKAYNEYLKSNKFD